MQRGGEIMTQTEFMVKEINEKLVNGKIVESIVEQKSGNFGFRVKRSNGEFVNVWIDSDSEGNDIGWLSLEVNNKKGGN